jgi:uncharacterized protein YkwD
VPKGAGADFMSGPASMPLRSVTASQWRPALPRRLALLLVLAPLLAAQAQTGRPRTPDNAAVAERVVQQTNEFRSRNDLSALKSNRPLAEAAQRFAEFMAETDRYGHQADDREPAERAQAHGYEHCAIAENIAYQFSSAGFGTDELAGRLMEGWEQSPPHRKNMLLPHMTEIGVGVARSERTRRHYAVQMFGRPQSASTRFEVANRADATVRYELAGKSFNLPPRVTRTHEGCFDGTLKVLGPDAPPSPEFRPRDGARYTVLRDTAGKLDIQTK